MAKGGGGSTRTKFNAGSVPQSLYDLTSQIGNYRQNMLQPYDAQIQGIIDTSLREAGGTQTDPYLATAQNLWGQLTGLGGEQIKGGSQVLQQGITDLNQVPGYSTILGSGTPFFNQANSMFQTAAPLVAGNLTPEQQAYINQATQAQQAGITQQLANEGLTSSTMLQEKLGQAAQSGAATAGQLIQGNIALGEQEQGLGINEQGTGISMINAANAAANTQLNRGQTEANLGLNLQTTGANYLTAVANSNMQAQSQYYNEAMAGYGVLGNMLQEQLASFGYQLSGEQIKVGASSAANQVQAGIMEQQQQAEAQGFSGLLSGLGSLLGGKGGGGGIGGLVGGAASLFGGGSAAAGGSLGAGLASSAAAGGSVAGIGSAIGSALTALSAAFCHAARELFGVENPEWMLLRDLMLFRAPKWLRRFYIRHAVQIAGFLHKKELTKKVVRTLLRVIMP